VIIIHLRFGDHIGGKWGEWTLELAHYKKALDFVYGEKFAGYENKHLVVISEDIEFCKEHYDEIGFGVAGDEITFVDWNHHYNSYRDMQIISMGKIIIKSVGGFALAGALISKTVDYLIQTDNTGTRIEWQREGTEKIQ
jgi:hypothetical protein